MTSIVLSITTASLLIGCTVGTTTVTAIAINPKRPNFIYIATNNKIYKSKDGGETWAVMTEGLGTAPRVISLAIHPELTSTVYAGTWGDSVYRSLDGGQHWSIINAGMKEHVSIVNSFAFHPENPNIFFAGLTVGIFKTENAGLMWDDVPNKGMDSVYVVPLILDHSDPNVLYAGTSGGVYRSSNGGQTWVLLHKGMLKNLIDSGLELGVNTLAQDPVHTNKIYAGTTNGAYKSTNRGDSWSKIAGGLGDDFIAHILIDPQEHSTLYAGTTQGVFRSQDEGDHWTPIQEGLTTKNVRYMAMDPTDPKIIYAGTQKGLFKTVNGGEAWRELTFMQDKNSSS